MSLSEDCPVLSGTSCKVIDEIESIGSNPSYLLPQDVPTLLTWEGVQKDSEHFSFAPNGEATVVKKVDAFVRGFINSATDSNGNRTIFFRMLVDGVQVGNTLQTTMTANGQVELLFSKVHLSQIGRAHV